MTMTSTLRHETIGVESLTPREIEVLKGVADGLNNDQLGAQMFISRETVKTHLKHVFIKLGVSSRAEAVALCLRQGAFK